MIKKNSKNEEVNIDRKPFWYKETLFKNKNKSKVVGQMNSNHYK